MIGASHQMTDTFRLYDQIQIIKNQILPMSTTFTDYTEHRYEQRGFEYTLRSWCDKDMTVTASMVDRPPWLKQIIDLAIVGGHIHPVAVPPPDLIVWFSTVPGTNELIEFIDFNQP